MVAGPAEAQITRPVYFNCFPTDFPFLTNQGHAEDAVSHPQSLREKKDKSVLIQEPKRIYSNKWH